MIRLLKILVGLLVMLLTFSGCESFLDVKSDSVIFPDENQLDSPNDTIYSMVGIFSQLEKLAERYVLLGELRGDLMDLTSLASTDLQEIYNHSVSEDNPYNQIEDYYAVINNCNYLITRMDTSVVSGGKKVLYKEFAAAKAIRAWTYLQLALNYGSVKYYTQPILTIKDAENYTEYKLNELASILIQDILPFKDIPKPGIISFGSALNSSYWSYFPINFLLGDLYLWNGEYENAARAYYELIVDDEYIMNTYTRNTWTVVNGVFVKREYENTRWPFQFTRGSELITLIASSTENGKGDLLDSITTGRIEVIPSQVALNNWNEQTYYYSSTVATEGDLRGDWGSYMAPNSTVLFGDLEINFGFSSTQNAIFKYYDMSFDEAKYISVYRAALLYLRYSEAVNRAGKPNLAFATIKNGLSSETMSFDTVVPPREKYINGEKGQFVDYANFEDDMFEYSIGVHERGCGNVNQSVDFVIPALATLNDTIEWVEDKIVTELALETAFEGNRFHDLMRVALRRNDPSYLADKVAAKYTSNQEAIRSKLMSEDDWYLK